MRYLVFLLMWLSILSLDSFTIKAQGKAQLSGRVLDKETGESLIGASVVLQGTSTGVATNQYGFYSLTLPQGKHTLEFSFLGFQTREVEVEVRGDQTLDIKLANILESLQEVVVSAERLGSKARTAQIGVEKMSSQLIKKLPVVLGESDILKSIQLLPGITDGGEGVGGMYIRGGSSDQNLVLLDGATVYNSSHLFGFVSTFNSDVVNDIQVFKGGTPPQYGGRLSGVLDVMQKEGNNQKYALAGGIGTLSSRLMVEGPIKKDKGSFLVAGRRSYADVFLRMAGETNVLYFYDLNFKLNYKLNDKHRLYASGYLGRDVLGFSDFDFNSEWGNSSLNLRWNNIISSKLFANLTYNLSDYVFKLSFPDFILKSGIVTHNLKYDLSYYGEGYKIRTGLNARHYDFEPGEVSSSTVSLDNKYATMLDYYLGLEHELSEKLSVNYGFRLSSFYRMGPQEFPVYENGKPLVYDPLLQMYLPQDPIGFESYSRSDVIDNYLNFEPRLSAVYRFNKDLSMKVGYERMVQYLHLISNTNAPAPYDTWLPADRYIEPMKSDQLSGGIFANIDEGKWECSLELFYKDISNLVDYIDGADLTGNNYVENQILTGEARAYGLELFVKKHVGRLTGWMSYTYTRTERKVPGFGEGDVGINGGEYYPSTYDRPHDLSLVAMYEGSEKWSFSSNFIYQTGRPTTYIDGYYYYDNMFVPHYESRNRERLPDYHRLDVSATLTPKKNKSRKLQLQYIFNIYNVYARKNASTVFFDMESTGGGKNLQESREYLQAKQSWIFGIVPSVTVNFKW